jgi:hypothetical protein
MQRLLALAGLQRSSYSPVAFITAGAEAAVVPAALPGYLDVQNTLSSSPLL